MNAQRRHDCPSTPARAPCPHATATNHKDTRRYSGCHGDRACPSRRTRGPSHRRRRASAPSASSPSAPKTCTALPHATRRKTGFPVASNPPPAPPISSRTDPFQVTGSSRRHPRRQNASVIAARDPAAAHGRTSPGCRPVVRLDSADQAPPGLSDPHAAVAQRERRRAAGREPGADHELAGTARLDAPVLDQDKIERSWSALIQAATWHALEAAPKLRAVQVTADEHQLAAARVPPPATAPTKSPSAIMCTAWNAKRRVSRRDRTGCPWSAACRRPFSASSAPIHCVELLGVDRPLRPRSSCWHDFVVMCSCAVVSRGSRAPVSSTRSRSNAPWSSTSVDRHRRPRCVRWMAGELVDGADARLDRVQFVLCGQVHLVQHDHVRERHLLLTASCAVLQPGQQVLGVHHGHDRVETGAWPGRSSSTKNVCATGAGSARPVVSMMIPSKLTACASSARRRSGSDRRAPCSRCSRCSSRTPPRRCPPRGRCRRPARRIR